jgi:hypothetical protein
MKVLIIALCAAILIGGGFLIWKSNGSSPITQEQAVVSNDPDLLKFDDDPTAPGYDVALNYFAEDIAAAKKLGEAVPPSVGVVEVDLNTDGQMEIIATLQGSGVCGAHSCPTAILMKRDDTWENVLGNVSAQFVSLAPTYTNGMQDLVLASGDKVWKWNGEVYE